MKPFLSIILLAMGLATSHTAQARITVCPEDTNLASVEDNDWRAYLQHADYDSDDGLPLEEVALSCGTLKNIKKGLDAIDMTVSTAAFASLCSDLVFPPKVAVTVTLAGAAAGTKMVRYVVDGIECDKRQDPEYQNMVREVKLQICQDLEAQGIRCKVDLR